MYALRINTQFKYTSTQFFEMGLRNTQFFEVWLRIDKFPLSYSVHFAW